jgi:hypothetical protein
MGLTETRDSEVDEPESERKFVLVAIFESAVTDLVSATAPATARRNAELRSVSSRACASVSRI